MRPKNDEKKEAIYEFINEYIKEFGKAGATIPICGFGSTLAKGAMEGVKSQGIFGAFIGGMTAASAGIAAAIIFGFVIAIIFDAKNKR